MISYPTLDARWVHTTHGAPASAWSHQYLVSRGLTANPALHGNIAVCPSSDLCFEQSTPSLCRGVTIDWAGHDGWKAVKLWEKCHEVRVASIR
mmetsp:Transcript_73624/g.159287  ORF Transcript_73624/g.159287 Transcript_73624/m.159287 type:complete len:93 (+) Transcript_73624:1209-1487(+)